MAITPPTERFPAAFQRGWLFPRITPSRGIPACPSPAKLLENRCGDAATAASMMDLLLPLLLPLRGKLLLLLLLLMLAHAAKVAAGSTAQCATPGNCGKKERRARGIGLARRHAALPPDRMLAAASRLAMATRLSKFLVLPTSPGQRKEHKGWRPHAQTRPHRHRPSRSSSINFCIAFAHVPPPVIMVQSRRPMRHYPRMAAGR